VEELGIASFVALRRFQHDKPHAYGQQRPGGPVDQIDPRRQAAKQWTWGAGGAPPQRQDGLELWAIAKTEREHDAVA